jgi:serine/threonine-protein kinase RsbW
VKLNTVVFPLEIPTETMFWTLDSRLASVEVTESAVFELATRAGFEGLSLDRISLAVREITTNAIIHGNRYDPGKKVFVAISRTPSRLEINISDQGAGFDPNAVPDPLDPDALLLPSGRGLHLARAFMDELHVRDGDLCGATVVLVKYVSGFARQNSLMQEQLS